MDPEPVNPEAALPVDPAAAEAIAPQISSPQPSRLRRVFTGADGLRAGWSALIFVLIFAAIMGAAVLITLKLVPGGQPGRNVQYLSLRFAYANEGFGSAAVLFATWIMAKVERRGRSYGYGGAHKLKLFAAGLGTGLILIALLVLILYRTGLLVVENRLIFGAEVARYGVLWLLAFVLVGVFEESVTRGFLLYTLARGFSGLYRWAFKTRNSPALGFWTAALILSVIFFLGHTGNPGESPVGLLSVFVAGLFFSLSVWRTGSVWWGIGMHAAWDWGQSFLFGVADSGLMVQHRLLATHPVGKPLLSGGTTGPEGSIFILAVLALGSLIIVFTLPKAHYGDAPVADQALQTANAVA